METAGELSERTSSQEWAVCISALSFLIAFAANVFHFWSVMSVLFVGTKVEGFLALFLVAGWAGGVAVATDSDNDLAVDYEGQVQNGNLYYFGWASFVCSVTILANYLQSVYSVDMMGELRNKAKRMTLWSASLAVCIVVMASSANVYENVCDSSPPQESGRYCERTAVGISFGCMGALISLIIVSMKISDSIVPFFYEAFATFIMVIFYAFGVAFITSNDGPGAPLGNLYYSSWSAFLISLMLLKSCFEDYQSAKALAEKPNGAGNGNLASDPYANDIPVETLEGDDNI